MSRAATPDWFTAALAAPSEDRSVTVDGATVRYRAWGPVDGDVVVLIHGGAAHAGWWDHVAPLLASGRRVVALDLTGHGASDPRPAYDFETWSDEVMAVAAAEGSASPYVVGHSMGGVAALTAAYRHADAIACTIVIDPPDWILTGRVPPTVDELPARRYHPTREQAEQRWRATPPDPRRRPYVERHVAVRSVQYTEYGWCWRFDHAVTTHASIAPDLWDGERGPLLLVVAERGLLDETGLKELDRRLGGVPTLTVVDSGHHIMLDQPLALAAALNGALAGLDVVEITKSEGGRG